MLLVKQLQNDPTIRERNRVQSFLLTNLAVADLLMGVYLIIIAVHDAKWTGNYFRHDIEWRSGIGCNITGALSMLSSEVSVFILTTITIDRLICIALVFKCKPLTRKTAYIACAVIWSFSIFISVLPVTNIKYFRDDITDTRFYGHSAVCLPFQLSEERPAGFEYSVAIYIVLKCISFVFIFISYFAIFIKVKRTTRSLKNQNLRKDTAMVRRVIFIVMTDLCCWMPVIILGLLSITGNFSDPEKTSYVWIAVFVLPLNSAINPILYTFSTEQVQSKLFAKARSLKASIRSSLGLPCSRKRS